MRQKLEKTAALVLTDKDRGLQSLSGIMATPEQARDLQQFHEIGNQHFKSYVRYHILREPSAKVPQRKNRLLTFSTSFVRLIGTVYFKKHFAAFKFDSPRTYLNSFALEGVSITGQHKKWLRDIKATVWERVEFEDELPPSWEALWRHWLRSCWVSHYWSQAVQNQYSVLKAQIMDGN